MEVTVVTPVSAANEPLLKVIRASGDLVINVYLEYPTTGGNADRLQQIKDMAVSARELFEKQINRSLASQVKRVFWTLDEVKRNNYRMSLPECPLSSITSVYVTYSDSDDVELDADNNDYYLVGDQYPDIQMSQVTGTAGTGYVSGYEVTYTCGYDATNCEAIPEALVTLMCKQVAQWYAKRDEYVPVLSSEIKKALAAYTRNTWI